MAKREYAVAANVLDTSTISWAKFRAKYTKPVKDVEEPPTELEHF